MSAPPSDHLSARGHAWVPGRSQRLAACMVTSPQGGFVNLVAADDGRILARAQSLSLRREVRLGSLPSCLIFPSGWQFHCDDHDAVDRIVGADRRNLLHWWEAWHSRLVLAMVPIVAGGVLIWRWGLDLLVALAVALTPAGLPERIDDGHVAFIDQVMADPSALDDGQKGRVRHVFHDIVSVAPEPPFGPYTLLFRDIDGLGPNAFALPGGTIIVTDALVRTFPDPNVIAGVLGHEIAHVSEQHGLKRVYRSIGTFLLVALIAGDVGPIVEDMLLEGALLLSLARSRDQELEADRIGIGLAFEAGYDPEALVHLFEHLSGDNDVPSWLSTHPTLDERVPAILRMADSIGTTAQ